MTDMRNPLNGRHTPGNSMAVRVLIAAVVISGAGLAVYGLARLATASTERAVQQVPAVLAHLPVGRTIANKRIDVWYDGKVVGRVERVEVVRTALEGHDSVFVYVGQWNGAGPPADFRRDTALIAILRDTAMRIIEVRPRTTQIRPDAEAILYLDPETILDLLQCEQHVTCR